MLRTRLQSAMDIRKKFQSDVWGNPQAMTTALVAVRKSLGDRDGGAGPEGDAVQAALRRFATTQQVVSFTELKYVCYGLTVPLGEDDWRLIERQPLFDRLLHLVERHSGQASLYRRCYHGLLTGYFAFDLHSQSSANGSANWARLREYLGGRLDPIVATAMHRGVVPEWLNVLSSQRNLLTTDPCSQYAQNLQNGDTDAIKSLCSVLGIPSTSWVWDEALMAYVRAVCNGEDVRYQRDLPAVLRLVNGESELKLAQMLSRRATALTVSRYARCRDHPEQPVLRDTSVRLIGNPWLNLTAWDAHVQDEPARQMIESWLKKYLIRNFFELLAHDGQADVRRLNYWLEWEPKIDRMWFVLGNNTRENSSKAFLELRNRMTGLDRVLTESPDENNAFVMLIGPLLVIEFGVTGNACYVFAAGDFNTDLAHKNLSLPALKQRTGATRLVHRGLWEPRFDYVLRTLSQAVPVWKSTLREFAKPEQLLPERTVVSLELAPAPSPVTSKSLGPSDLAAIHTQCKQLGVDWEDNRSKNGALWLLIPDRRQHREFGVVLETCGFKHAEGRGFWFKGKA